MKSPLIIFCGKGGVGKTTLSLALGLLHARKKKRVVVVTSHPLSELAVSISLDGLREADATAACNLFVVHIDPRQLLARTVKEQIPSRMLARAVLSSKIYQSLIEIAPGLKEIAFLARLRELAERRLDDSNDLSFQVLIWDAPATGHFLETLRVSKKFDTYLTGPFAATGRELNQFFSERANLILLPVTTLEEMAVEETIELCEKLDRELQMKPASVICNIVSPLLSAPDGVFQDLRKRLVHTGLHSPDLEFVLDRHRIERERFSKLRSSLLADFHMIQLVQSWKSDLDLLFALAKRLAALPQIAT